MASFYKTNLIQVNVDSASAAVGALSRVSGNDVPLVAVPDDRCSFSCMLAVPSGPFCIMHRWGQDVAPDNLADPGLHCTPSWNRIAYCVSSQSQTYNAPVKHCPTADNVMVDCDLTLIFQIGPAPRDVKRFVYFLGARRFDEFLYAAVEEGIRHLIRSCKHTDVYELKGSSDPRVMSTLRQLNLKFNKTFGVYINQVAITEVRFKQQLQNTLQETTNYKSRINEENKKQFNAMEKIRMQETRELAELDKQNQLKVQDKVAERDRIVIRRSELLEMASSKAEINITRAGEKSQVNETRADAEKRVGEAEGLKTKEETVSVARIQSEKTLIRVRQECQTIIFESEQRLAASRALAAAIVAEAEAEEKAAEGLKAKREHDLELARQEVLQEIASTSAIVISGEQGDRILRSLLDPSILGKLSLDAGGAPGRR